VGIVREREAAALHTVMLTLCCVQREAQPRSDRSSETKRTRRRSLS
jgi:hypothetical protein